MRISDWSSDVCSSDLGSSWHGCRLDKTCLNDAVLSNAHFSDCRGTGATLRAARLDHTWMQNVEWRDCDFHGADLTRLAALDSAFRACAMQAAVIAEAWLSQCTLQDLDLGGVCWDKVLLPDCVLDDRQSTRLNSSH